MASLRPLTALLAAAVALASTARATTVQLPPCLDPFQPFVYSGCFQDGGNPSTLSFRSELDSQDMTVEACVSLCKGNGYRYAGLEYYGVCYCGQTVNGADLEEDKCSFPCTGNSSQTCGGDNTISVYQDPTFLPHDDEIDVDDYMALGCWTDDSPFGKALSYRQDQVDGNTLTNEKCLKACRDGGFPFAGTEYSGECYCGVVIGNGTDSAPSEQCNMPCHGDSSETCGGPARLNLYVAKDLQSLEPCGYEPPVSSSSSALPSSSTSSTPPSSITSSVSVTPPPSSTIPSSSSKTSEVCTSTITKPSDCEYKCGKWCAHPIPDWDDVKDCKSAFASCKLQVAACFKTAGFPDALNCFNFGEWCSNVDDYCKKPPKGGCNKPDFWKKHPPKGGKPPTTTVITTTCKPTATTTKTPTPTPTTTKCPIPTPTNICVQPTNKKHGYGPGNPVGGIELPVVTCNDLAADWPGKPFKLYNNGDSKKCKGYTRPSCPNACADACKEQYEDCLDVYAKECQKNKKGRKNRDVSYFDYAPAPALDKRTFGWKDNYPTAVEKCKAQYKDCLDVNKKVNGAGKCPKFGYF